MALENITKRILDDAKEEAQQIISKAKEDYELALKEEKKKIKEAEKAGMARAEAEAQEEIKRRIALARLEARKKILQEQQDLMENVFHKALEKVKNLPAKEYKKVIIKIVSDKYIPETEQIILSSDLLDKDKEQLIENINKQINNKGKGLSISSETLPERAGLILKGKEMEVNCTWDVIIKSIREENTKEIFKILFGDEA